MSAEPITAEPIPEPTPVALEPPSWTELDFLGGDLALLRLLLERRIAWLRHRWDEEGAPQRRSRAVRDEEVDRLLAAPDRGAESRFWASDLEARSLSVEIASRQRDLAAERRALAEADVWPPLSRLTQLFDLSPFERAVLVLALAPQLDPSFERIYAYAHDDPARRCASRELALALFAGPGAEEAAAVRSLLPDGTLRWFRLLDTQTEAGGGLSLRLTERVFGYLVGQDRLDPEAAAVLDPVPPAPLPESHEEIAGRLAGRVAELLRGDGWPRIELVGPPGSGRCALAREAARLARLQLYELDAIRAAQAGPSLLPLLARECALSQLAYLVRVEGGDAKARRELLGLAERLRAPLFLVAEEPLGLEGPVIGARVARPSASEQRELWRQVLGPWAEPLAGDLPALVEQFDFGPGAILAVARRAAEGLRLAPGSELDAEGLWRACRHHAGGQLGKLAQRIEPVYGWDDLVVPADVGAALRALSHQVAHRHQVYREWGFAAKLSRGLGISALFAGPSGTGKTMAAEVLARELGLDLYRIDLSSVVSKYIGETERNLRGVFDAAEQCGAILFFDEADALFGKRTEVKDSHDRYANIEIDYLLQRMEEYRGLAILATNVKGHLDQAFLRRLRFVIELPFPEAAERRAIWQGAFPGGAPLGAIDYDALSRLQLTGGNIKNIALNAAFAAAEAGSPIGMEQLLTAARREFAKEERLWRSGEAREASR